MISLRDPLIIALGATVAGCALLVVANPSTYFYPPCPSQLLLGIDCPACGGLRATSALLQGDFASFADHNALLIVIFPLLIFTWALAAWRKRYPLHVPALGKNIKRNLWMSSGVILALFTLARNIFPYLGSGIG